MTLQSSIWNSIDSEELMRKYIGRRYINLEEISNAKKAEAKYIADYLNLSSNSTVIDLGPGLGLIASNLAPLVKHLYCVDISKSFLRESIKHLKEHNNISFELIEYGNLSKFSDIDSVYCLAVFIHFNIYDISIYLEEIYNVLKNNGTVLFDYYDVDFFNNLDETFIRHKALYKQDQAIRTNINFNSTTAILNICESLGYKTEIKRAGPHPLVLARKHI